MTMDMHGMHELGVFDFALGVAFLVGAFRPRLANGLAWPCAAAALGLVVTSAVDLVTHRTFEMHELRHLIAIAGAALLCLSARYETRAEPDDLGAAAANLQLHRREGNGEPPGRAVGGGAAWNESPLSLSSIHVPCVSASSPSKGNSSCPA